MTNSDQVNPTTIAQGFKPDFAKISALVKEILLNPTACWDKVKSGYGSIKDLYLNFIVILAAIPAVVHVIQLAIIGIPVPVVGITRTPFFTALGSAIVYYIISLVTLFIGALIVEFLAPKFNGSVSRLTALQFLSAVTAVTSVTSIFGIVPILGWLIAFLGGLYGIYVFYSGITPMTGVPQEKRLFFTIACVVIWIILAIIMSAVAMPAVMTAS